MNNTFNIKRFGLVMRKDFQENWKRYTVQFLAMFGVIVLVMFATFFSMKNSDFDSKYINSDLLLRNCLIFLGFGWVFASTCTAPMRSKIKRASYLMLPASSLEKYVLRWLIVTVGYIIAFLVALFLADVLRVAFFSIYFSDVHLLDFGKLIGTGITTIGYDYVFYTISEFYLFIGVFFLFQSICILGSTFWEKASFVKTFATLTIAGFLFFTTAYWAISLFYNDIYHYSEILESIPIRTGLSDDEMGFITAFVMIGICVFLTLVNWVFTFFRFRESEIIKRL